MHRRHAVPALIQCAVFAAGAGVLWTRLPALCPLVAAAALAQAVLAGRLLHGEGARLARWVAVASLVVAAVALGVLLETTAYVFTRFTDIGARSGWQLLGGGLVALPWVAGIPLWQLFTAPGRTLAPPTGLVVLLICGATAWHGHDKASADRTWSPVDGAAAAAWMLEREGAPPDSDHPVLLVATVIRNGKARWSMSMRGGSLARALEALHPPALEGNNSGLILEVVRAAGPLSRPWLQRGRGLAAPAGSTGFRTERGVVGAWSAWQGERVSGALLATVRTPALQLAPDVLEWVQVDGWLATPDGVTPLERSWSRPQPFEPDTLLAAALAGGHHLAANMGQDGRFAYVVEGPSGKHGPGYNFPRHAGGAWFLARLWQRTRDPVVREALDAALDFLARHTTSLDDGRTYVLDPARRDGKAWVGTNALALLALLAAEGDPDLAQGLANHLASSVDDVGRIRGDFDVAGQTWPAQPLVTYAQGQVLLGLAAAERAGLSGIRPALERAADFIESDYWPLGAGLYLPLDEHWMCLASAAAQEVLPRAAGERICRAWIQDRVPPPPGSDLAPPAGPAAATGEAWIAAAELDRRAGRRTDAYDGALAYARILLDHAYQLTDSPLLTRPERLVGGFRDRPHQLDVRVDAVQHIACALLGAEQLLRDSPLPGSMP